MEKKILEFLDELESEMKIKVTLNIMK